MPCSPLWVENWKQILLYLRRPIAPPKSKSTWSELHQHDLATMMRLNSAFHYITGPILYEVVVTDRVDLLFDDCNPEEYAKDGAVDSGFCDNLTFVEDVHAEHPNTFTIYRHKSIISDSTGPSSMRRRTDKFHLLQYIRILHVVCPAETIYRPYLAMIGRGDFSDEGLWGYDRHEAPCELAIPEFERIEQGLRRALIAFMAYHNELMCNLKVITVGSRGVDRWKITDHSQAELTPLIVLLDYGIRPYRALGQWSGKEHTPSGKRSRGCMGQYSV